MSVIAGSMAAFEPAGAMRRARRGIVGLWCVIAVALCCKAWFAPADHTTYPCFEAGARCWQADRDMYDTAICGHEYRYSPTFSVLFLPFASLPTHWGGMLWSLLNVAVLVWSLRRSVQDLLPANWTPLALVAFHALVALASLRGLWSAQSNLLIFSCIAVGAASIARRQWWLAATLLAAPVYIKVWPLAAGMLFVAAWPRQLGWRFTISMIALALIPFATRPLGIVVGHYHEFVAALVGPMQERHIYRDAWTIWELLLPPVNPRGYQALQLAAAGGALAVTLWARWRQISGRITTGSALSTILGIWTVWQLVFGPGVERNTICLIAPLTAWGLILSHQSASTWGRLWMGAGFVLTTLFSFGVFERLLLPVTPAALAALPCGSLCFAVWLLRYAEPPQALQESAASTLADHEQPWRAAA